MLNPETGQYVVEQKAAYNPGGNITARATAITRSGLNRDCLIRRAGALAGTADSSRLISSQVMV
jgi:hypothetical protein